ncbi:ABC transporter family substrate-binding protein [Paramicrobacterium fandaimingii]|uniref:ABC transporter family substrate-binding protein n=1 Tax=Paramicrobacterium fandaimingii TaxID=2708079 RepID=UPI001420CE60|nr:ABC transporter family substrate-binding protein [Microbacterium fandaimingii]
MRQARKIIAGGALIAGVLGLAGCAQTGPDAESSVAIGTSDRFTSYNTTTPSGSASGNADITALTLSNFTAYDESLEVAPDTSFGTVEKIADDPLVVRYTVSDTATWSDGTPVDAADLLLDWAAHSGALNTEDFDPADYRAAASEGGAVDLPDDVVFFDSGARPDSGLGLASEMPQLSDDGRSMTITYSQPVADWRIALPPPLPAHVVGQEALGVKSSEEAAHAVIDAVTHKDSEALSKISSFWNTGFALDNVDSPQSTYVSSGPYVIDEIDPVEGVTLSANPEYDGAHAPSIATVHLRYLDDPATQVTALENGDVDVIAPQATPAVAEQLAALDDKKTFTGLVASFEHIDLQFGASANGTFDDPLVREAFLKTVPRQAILEKLIKPIVGSGARTRDSFVFTPGTPGYDESAADAAFSSVDIAGAKALLEKAGAVEPEVCVLYAANNPRRAAEFDLIAESAAKAGFSITDCGTDQWRQLLGVPGKYDAAIFAWESSSLGAVDSESRYATEARNNLNGYSSKTVDALFSDIGESTDAGERSELLADVDSELRADFYGAPLYQFPSITAFDPDHVTGVTPRVIAPTLTWNLWEWRSFE